MTYAITQTCCSDATCIAVCPVNCIHPTPEERAFGSTEMLHVDPKACIDCGACADACPVDAIFPADSLMGGQREYIRLNAEYYETGPGARAEDADSAATGDVTGDATGEQAVPVREAAQPAAGSPNFHAWGRPAFDRVLPPDFARLRVAVVGTGPAGMYAAEDLLLHTNAEVTLVDRLPVAGGLVRYGVAPDHPATKKVGDTFARFHDHPRVRMHLGVEIGKHLTAEELAAHHDAVIYAVGASTDRRLGIPGEDLPGSVSATAFVSWYNGHPEAAPDAPDLGTERVVVVGNGNVALDVARILVADPEQLAGTDIADHALAALRDSKVREVVVLGRRGPEDAAYTRSELLALKHLPGVDLLVDDHDPRIGTTIDAAAASDKAGLLQGVTRTTPDLTAPPAPGRRIVLRFHSSSTELVAGSTPADDPAVRGVRVTGGGDGGGARAGDGTQGGGGTEITEILTGLMLRAIGYRGMPVAGLPFDEAAGTVPHEGGRVAGMPGTYVVGWIKRGPSGGIGANRTCAAETVGTLLADAVAGALPAPTREPKSFTRFVRARNRRVVDARGLAAIHHAETTLGHEQGRPRVKLTTIDALLSASKSRTTRWNLLRK
ncbi:ferredoxin-NADP reductase [Streptomyces triticagri]|uniref:ferredoxin--NADP(+) reductase n=1 Tax=Streptomyces triticagri TaxID=2293568 RepID=A0A372MBU2_9ACTN|nr:FAD-dependent oxidoreductase [Streptomyces triticagri]RFU88369.1 ferredoxin-NADP reductase [Streptomyces triticagri]